EVALRIVWNSAIGPSLHLERVWPTTSQASAFSPCNITGFFRIYNSARDPLRIGSTGVGVALGTGVTTMVSLRRTRRPRIVARFNGNQLSAEAVSIEVARRYCELDGRSWNTQISHQSPVQSDLGYGTSGSGALSLSLALNEEIGRASCRERVEMRVVEGSV